MKKFLTVVVAMSALYAGDTQDCSRYETYVKAYVNGEPKDTAEYRELVSKGEDIVPTSVSIYDAMPSVFSQKPSSQDELKKIFKDSQTKSVIKEIRAAEKQCLLISGVKQNALVCISSGQPTFLKAGSYKVIKDSRGKYVLHQPLVGGDTMWKLMQCDIASAVQE